LHCGVLRSFVDSHLQRYRVKGSQKGEGTELVAAAALDSHEPVAFSTPPLCVDVYHKALEYLAVLLGRVLEESFPRSTWRAVDARVQTSIGERGGGVSYMEGKGGRRNAWRQGC
jgi:hypothetical protein